MEAAASAAGIDVKANGRDQARVRLVGREREIGVLRAALQQMLNGQGQLVLVSGETGIGKTTLAESLLAEAQTQGALVLVGRCYDLSETPPYGPWAEALHRAPRAGELPAPPDFTGSTATSQAALFASARDYLAALAAPRPVVLLLDDLHWADPASLDLLRALARGLAATPLLLLATYRANELTRHHPLYQLLPTLVREAHAERLELRPLSDADLRELVRARFDLAPDDQDRLVAYLAGRTEGNPFFAGEVLRALTEAGNLRQAGDQWLLGSLDALEVPPLLRQVIDARVDRLGEEARELLAVAAAIGHAFPLTLWAVVAGVAEEALLEPAERATEAGLLAEADNGSGVRFTHALIREALYEGTAAIRRRSWHRRAGEALAAAPRADRDAVAYHFRRAGDPRAGEWLVRAGERAQLAYAWVTAAERFEAALPLLPDNPATAEMRGRLLLRIGLLRRYAGPDQALAYFESAGEAARAAGDAALVARARFSWGVVRCYQNHLALGIAAMEEAVAALAALTPGDAVARATLEAQDLADDLDAFRGTLALWLANVGRYSEAMRLAEGVVARLPDPMPAGVLDVAFAPDAARALGNAYAALGRPAEARRMLRRTLEAYRAAGNLFQVGLSAWNEFHHVVLPYHTDDLAARRLLLAEGEAAFLRAAQLGTSQLDPRSVALATLLLEGHWAALWAWWQEVRHLGELWWVGQREGWIVGTLARHRGEIAEVWDFVRRVTPASEGAGLGDVGLIESLPLLRLSAAVALDAGDLPAARSWLDLHDHWLTWSGALLGQSEGQAIWAQYHRALGDLSPARNHAVAALAHAGEPRQPLALLAAHRLLGELDTEAGHHGDARAHLDAALALADACAAPYERALTLLALADLRAASGQRAAEAALVEARTILEPLAARPALARADALAQRLAAPAAAPPRAAFPCGLSAREVDVLRLVSEGLTDAQVAERLFLSRRTVNTHLTSVYNKLGVNSRAAATRFAVEHGLI